MITVELPPEAERLLAEMARANGRTIEQIAVDAILERIEDWEDAIVAERCLREDDGVRVPLSEVIRDIEEREAKERAAKSAAE